MLPTKNFPYTSSINLIVLIYTQRLKIKIYDILTWVNIDRRNRYGKKLQNKFVKSSIK